MAEQAQVALRLCIKHPNEEMDLYCKVCKTPTCNECMESDHVGHSFDTIAKLYRKMKNTRPDLIRELEQKINPKRTQNRRHLHTVKSRNKNLLKMNMENVERKRSEMHEAVDIIINAHVDSLNSHNDVLDEEVSQIEKEYRTEESVMLKMMETFQKTTMVGLDFIEYYEQLKSKADVLQTIDLSKHCNIQIYGEGKLNRKDLKTMIGEIKEVKSNAPTVEQISSFQNKSCEVHTISPISNERAWITYKGEKEFTLLGCDGSHIMSLPKDTATHSFILNDSAFLLSNLYEENINKIDMHGKISIWMDVSPLRPRFIGNALNGNILISLVDEDSGSRTVQSERKVQMLTSSCEILYTYEYSDDGTTGVLTRPNRVIQNYNSDVCVVNQYETAIKGKFFGNICVFYEDGSLKHVYSGGNGKFNPTGISCDPQCNIICANYYDRTVHLLNSDGSFIQYLFTSDSCIPLPNALALHRGFLWVGSDQGDVRVYQYIV